jgi:uncharacterized protein YyaL (SSP411 family)
VLRAYWDVTPGGNFEGENILSVVHDPGVTAARFHLTGAQLADVVRRGKAALYAARRDRVWPGLDDKVLASWNGLMVRALAEAARAFERADYRDAAISAGEFLFAQMVRDGRALRSHKNGESRLAGYLEDHAALGLAAAALYELTFDARWLEHTRVMESAVVRWFWDDATGAFYDTASDHERLITRPRDFTDNATPSGTSLAVELLLRVSELFDDGDARRRANYVMETVAPAMARYPTAFGHMLGNADMSINGAVEVAIVGAERSGDFVALRSTLGSRYVPSLVLAGGSPGADSGIALLSARDVRGGAATAYVCRNYTCSQPVTDPDGFAAQLDAAARVAASG